jgi:hypothetical protein
MSISIIVPVTDGDDSPDARHADQDTWWGRYEERLRSRNFTASALRAIEEDADYILERITEGTGDDSVSRTSRRRVRKGLVFGAVQSGKTSSMFAVTAKCIDNGYDVVLILSGTRVGLWHQTYKRVTELLDKALGYEDLAKVQTRILIPSSDPIETSGQISSNWSPDLLYSSHPSLGVQRAVKLGRPLILTVMKHGSHLQAVKKFIRNSLTPRFLDTQSVRVLVIDDEADDGSVLDRLVENGQLEQYAELKQLPRHITSLWCDDLEFYGAYPYHQNLEVTYLAYTATPQANILQADHNPLKPTDFLATIRAPFNGTNRLANMAAYYNEPNGVSSYYTGGNVFYESLEPNVSGSLCVTNPARFFRSEAEGLDLNDALLLSGVRSFLVAGAVRLILSGRSYNALLGATFETVQAYRAIAPPIHTALIHPSPLREDHFLFRRILRGWLATGRLVRDEGVLNSMPDEVSIKGVIESIRLDPAPWEIWLSEFEATRSALNLPGVAQLPSMKSLPWSLVEQVLIDEILPNLHIKIINSDADSDYIPSFQCSESDGSVIPPADQLAIFVSGNVMSRGITLEGLCTSVFLRRSNQPLQDTQMQMQRWFGYRGAHVIWCRLFTDDDQYQLFREYHDFDLNLRCQISSRMLEHPHDPIDPMVLSSLASDPTGKIANLNKIPLAPGSSPFIRLLNQPIGGVDSNATVVSDFFASHNYELLRTGHIEKVGRGFITTNPISLFDAASLLDALKYSQHRPDPKSPVNRRWWDFGKILQLEEEDAQIIKIPNGPSPFRSALSANSCPYSIAAYLKLWGYCLTNNVPGLHKNGARNILWNHLDLSALAANPPRFFVGIRFGRGRNPKHDGLRSLVIDGIGIRTAEREVHDDYLVGSWGSRGRSNVMDDSDEPSTRFWGDQLFDYHHTGRTPPPIIAGEAKWRPEGDPGLILFYVVEDQEIDRIAVGVCIPLGGPDTIAMIKGP